MVRITVNEPTQDFQASSTARNQVVVFPGGATWIGVVRRPLQAIGLRVEAVPTLDACREALKSHPNSLLVLEFTADPAQSPLSLIAEIRERWPATRVVVVGRVLTATCEQMFRELGASDVIRRGTDYGRIIRIAQKHIDCKEVL